jgi:hypothetical protein
MDSHASFTFKFPPGCYYTAKDGTRHRLVSAAIRETDGRDEERSAVMAKSKGGMATATEEIVQLALTEVNDEPVNSKTPFQGFDRWNSRARQFAVAAWSKLNGAGKEEIDSFLAQLGATAAPTENESA